MNKLFKEFEACSAKQWKQKIQVDLKGADYNDTLIWNSPEGIDVKPFYHADDYKKPEIHPVTQTNSWSICQSIDVNHSNIANSEAINAINKGAESILFNVNSGDILLQDLFKGIDLNAIAIYFKFSFFDETLVQQLINIPLKSKIHFNLDIIGHLARTGNWFNNLKTDHQLLENVLNNVTDSRSILGVDMALYQNAGANMVQQLAYGLAHANEYLNHFGTKISRPLTFNLAVGSNYFFEIAKLRALRLLFGVLAREYNLNDTCYISAQPSKRNKTIYDYNNNMLRTTTESMSAILGGANTVCNLAYDSVYHNPNEFGNRISQNQLLVLKHESYFSAVSNPSDGAYYIEELTQELTEKALAVFKDIEANGGFLKQLKEGTLQRKIKESALKEQTLFNEGKEVLVGSNKYPNMNDKMAGTIERYPFLKHKKRKTLIEPILEKRLAEPIEKDRLQKEKK